MKKRMQEVSSRSLIVIDDRKIRMNLYRQAEKKLKKIDEWFLNIQNFHTQDEKMYQSWYQLTFCKSQEQVEKQNKIYAKLALFHNRVIALSQKENISLTKAYKKLKNIEAENLTESEEKKKMLDSVYSELDAYAKEQYQQQESFSDLDPDCTYGECKSSDFFDEEKEGEFNSDLSKELPKEQKQIYERVKSLSDNDIITFFKKNSREASVDFVLGMLQVTVFTKDLSFFKRIWLHTPTQFKKEANRQAIFMMGIGVDDFLNEFENNNEFDYISDKKNTHNKSIKVSLEEEVEIKKIYRSLARILHPDTQTTESSHNLFMSFWERLQKSYKNMQWKELKKLELLVYLKLKKLNVITLDELSSGIILLDEELRNVKSEANNFKKHPAWKFSAKDNHQVLENKIHLEFQEMINQINSEIENIQNLHLMLEGFSEVNNSNSPRRTQRKSRAHT